MACFQKFRPVIPIGSVLALCACSANDPPADPKPCSLAVEFTGGLTANVHHSKADGVLSCAAGTAKVDTSTRTMLILGGNINLHLELELQEILPGQTGPAFPTTVRLDLFFEGRTWTGLDCATRIDRQVLDVTDEDSVSYWLSGSTTCLTPPAPDSGLPSDNLAMSPITFTGFGLWFL